MVKRLLLTLPRTLLLLVVVLFSSLQAQQCDTVTSLGLADSNIIPNSKIVTSSEEEGHGKEQIRLDCCEGTYGSAWCPDPKDKQPFVEIHLGKPVSIGEIDIQAPTMSQSTSGYPENYMKTFDLLIKLAGINQLVKVAQDVSAIANGSVSLNRISLYPTVFTDVIRIEPRDSENLPCFRMELYQCETTSMCPRNFCQNNGTCSQPNTCDCPDFYYGERCQYSKESIPLTVYKFLQIIGNTIITASHNLTFHGSVSLDKQNVLVVQPGGYLNLLDFSQSSCFSDLDRCTSGFTINLVFSISKLDTNSIVVLSNGGADDARIRGINLLFYQGNLHCYASTSEKLWTIMTQFTLAEATWYKMTISWSLNLGLIVLQDRELLGSTFIPLTLDTLATRTNLLTLGNSEETSTSVLHFQEITMVPLDWQEFQRADLDTADEDKFIDRYWDLRDIFQSVIESHNWYLNLKGKPAFGEDGVTLTTVDQFIEIPDIGSSCLTDPSLCTDGLTLQINIKLATIEEDSVIFTTGGEYKNHPGVALLYRYGQFHAIVSTESFSWFVSVSRTTILTRDFCDIILSWSQHTSLKLIINQVLVGESASPISHTNTSMPYIDKLTIGLGITECVISELHIWHSNVELLSQRGLIFCIPCSKPPTTSVTTAETQTTKLAQSTGKTTREATWFTDSTTEETTAYYDEDECPPGCVSSDICFQVPEIPSPEPTPSCDLTTQQSSPPTTVEDATTQQKTTSASTVTQSTPPPRSTPTPPSLTTRASTTTSTTVVTTKPPCPLPTACPNLTTNIPSLPSTAVTSSTNPGPPSTPGKLTTQPPSVSLTTEVTDTKAPQTTSSLTVEPQTTAPRTTAPQTTAPQTTAPQTNSPKTTAPQTIAPQTTPQRTTLPAITVPQTTVPQTTVPQTTAPQTTAPQTTASQTITRDSTTQQPQSSSTAEKQTTPKCTSSESCPTLAASSSSLSPATTVKEATTPTTIAPQTTASQTTGPHTTIPQTPAPQTTTSQTTVPQTTAPQTTASQTITRDSTTQPQSSSTTEKQTTPKCTSSESCPTLATHSTPLPTATTVTGTTSTTVVTTKPPCPLPTACPNLTTNIPSLPSTAATSSTNPGPPSTPGKLTTQPPSVSLTTEVTDTKAPQTTSSLTTAPRTTAPQTTAPQTTAPQTNSPKTTAPQTIAPQTTPQRTTLPAITVPQTTVPQTIVPQTTASQTTAPQTTVPQTTVPQTTAPQTTAPQTITRDSTTQQPQSSSTAEKQTTPKCTSSESCPTLAASSSSLPPATTVKEATTPTTITPQTTASQTTGPHTTIPQTPAPQTTTSQTTVPQTTAPQTTASQTITRDSTTQQPQTSSTTEKQTTPKCTSSESCPTLATPSTPLPPATTVTDATTSTIIIPKTTAPQTTVPQTPAPQTTTSQTTVPQTTAPQTTASQTITRDSTTQQPQTSSTTEKQTTPKCTSSESCPTLATPSTPLPPATTVTDATTSTIIIPKTTAPQTTVPQTPAPQTTTSQTTVPQTTAPQTTASQTITRDSTTQQPQSSSTTEKQTTPKCTSSESCPTLATPSTPLSPETTMTEATTPTTIAPQTTASQTTAPQTIVQETTKAQTTAPHTTSPASVTPSAASNPTSQSTTSHPPTVKDSTTPQSPSSSSEQSTTTKCTSSSSCPTSATSTQSLPSTSVTDTTLPPSSPTTATESTTPQPSTPTTTKATTTTRSTTTATKLPCPQPPSSVTLIPEVSSSGQGQLICSVSAAPEPGIKIRFTWKIEGSNVQWSKEIEAPERSASISAAEINVQILNTAITCTAEVRYSTPNAEWCWPERSNVVVPSIKCPPVNGTIRVIEGREQQILQVQVTVPPSLLCRPEDGGQCRVEVSTTITTVSNELKCSAKEIIPQAVLGVSTVGQSGAPSCGVAITSGNWQNAVTIPIKATVDGVKDGNRNRKLQISVRIIGQITSATSVETCGEIDVIVIDRDDGATCSSVNDPHIKTWDNVRYNNFLAGEFVLANHKYLQYEVRAHYSPCNPRQPRGATCNCGAAVRSGDDVITFDTCNTRQNQISLGSASVITVDMYKNGELTPGTRVIRHGCGQKYEVLLPSGTKVVITSSVKPFMNINLQASSYDFESTEGLCGDFNNNPSDDLGGLHTRNPDAFNKQWLRNVTIFKGVPAFTTPARPTFCSCQSGQQPVCKPGLDVYICNAVAIAANDITAALVSQAKTPVVFSQVTTSLNQVQRRGRRAADTTNLQNSAAFTVETGFTEETSQQYCQEYLENSTAVQYCLSHLNYDALNESIRNCAEDLMAQNDTQWATSHVDDLIIECLADVQANVTTWENNENEDGPNVPQYINSSLCTQNCGEHGSCINSICDCKVGWTGETCQIGSTTTPTVLSALGACDLMTTSCNRILVEGNNFISTDNLTCRIRYITIGDKVSVTAEEYTVQAIFISMIQVVCPENIASSLQSRSALVTLSNNGVTYSETNHIHIVEKSTCQTCTLSEDVNAVSCTWKPGSCVIDNQCYARFEPFEANTCYRCDPDVNLNKWTKISDPNCTITQPEVGESVAEPTDDTAIIALGVVCGVLALVAVGVIIAVVVRSRRRRSSKLQRLWEGDPSSDIYHRRAVPSSADVSGQSDAARINAFYNPALSS